MSCSRDVPAAVRRVAITLTSFSLGLKRRVPYHDPMPRVVCTAAFVYTASSAAAPPLAPDLEARARCPDNCRMIKAVRGTRDLLPPETDLWERVEAACRAVF